MRLKLHPHARAELTRRVVGITNAVHLALQHSRRLLKKPYPKSGKPQLSSRLPRASRGNESLRFQRLLHRAQSLLNHSVHYRGSRVRHHVRYPNNPTLLRPF
jgi:hypothetical protein